jgi:NAD(P)-dependent dehydrogenase (short-subunit alcohol dehydrogenase family)
MTPSTTSSIADGHRPDAASRDARYQLPGKVALVTGGGSGLGQATCHVLAEAGATVVVADINAASARAVADAVTSSTCPGTGISLPLDVSDADAVERAVDSVHTLIGRLDVVVNSAGVDVSLPVEELAVDDWDRVLATNLRGPFLLSRAAFTAMRQQGEGGRIVNIVSTAAKRAWSGASCYHASKWGLLGLSHALHVEGRPYGIAVTAVITGGMRTPFLLDRFPEIDPGVLQDPRNVAEAIRFAIEQPAGTVIPELLVMSPSETSWP